MRTVASRTLFGELQRNIVVPLADQLRNAIEVAVLGGELGANTALPSVRELADALAISRETVFRAYVRLSADGIILSRPRRGYYVVGIARGSNAHRRESLAGLIDETVRIAVEQGIDGSRLLDMISVRLRSQGELPRRVGVVSEVDAQLADKVCVIEESTRDLAVEVMGMSYDDLATVSGLDRAATCDYLLVPVLETERAQRLLGTLAQRIVPMTTMVRPDVRRFIASLPRNTRFGIIGPTPVWSGRILAAVRRIHPLRISPLTASLTQPRRVAEVIEAADALVIGPVAWPHLRQFQPLTVPHVQLIRVPDVASVRRLRAELSTLGTRAVASSALASSHS